jgi:diguanylate cyclase (GGDEF)-like protein
MVLFEWPLWGWLAGLRLGATMAFAGLALAFRSVDDIMGAWRALIWLFAVPTVFFVASHPVVNQFDPGSPAAAVAAGYAFLPFVMVAGLSMFPLTAVESMIFATPLMTAHLVAGVYGTAIFPFNSYLGAMWLLLLLATVATFAAMSQLHFMTALVEQSTHDKLTGVYSRRTGEELLSLQAFHAARTGRALSVAFVDLDDFKQVNDRHGHEAGDRILREAARALQNTLRHGDMVARWGGEEFLLIMPETDLDGAVRAIERLRERGLSVRPDGIRQTASIGIAESGHDRTWEPEVLVELADARMYRAKRSGKDRIDVGGSPAEERAAQGAALAEVG